MDDRTRRLLARRYAWELLDRALEEREYRSSTMAWPPEEHPAMMVELEKVRDTLYVSTGGTVKPPDEPTDEERPRDPTLDTLIAISKKYPIRRELCCPDCGGDIELKGGRYHCRGVPYDPHPPGSPTEFGTLAELAVRHG